MQPSIKPGDVVKFENGRDVHTGTVFEPYTDPLRPDMEETWTVLVPGQRQPFRVRARRMERVLGSV